jgi:uncharacterized protein with ParB-like and HNH nuclease domain
MIENTLIAEDSDVINLESLIESFTDIESDNEDEGLTNPFDPEEISLETRPITMETCLRRLKQKTIMLNPDFQRNEVWNEDKKSQLIESLMLKIPLPMFYVSADERNNFTVVDGLQRLSTIRSFILGDKYLENPNRELEGNGFKLTNLEFWKDYEGKNYNELPPHIQNRILETVFTFTVINPGTPEEVRRNIFKRINTGGLPLSSQEIRNALYMGHSSVLLKELSQYPEFKRAMGGVVKSLRMEDRELILRFLAFFVRDYMTYKKTISIDNFLSDTMIIVNAVPSFNSREFKRFVDREKDKEKKNKADTLVSDVEKTIVDTKVSGIEKIVADIKVSSIEEIRECFKKGMHRSYALFSSHTFRKSYGEHKRSQLNKSLFEMWGVLLSRLTDDEFSILFVHKEALMAEYIELLQSSTFQLAISKDSMKYTSVNYRFDKIKELINKNIQL